MKKVLVVFAADGMPAYVLKFAINMAKEHAWQLHQLGKNINNFFKL